jgi:hypothetical protein
MINNIIRLQVVCIHPPEGIFGLQNKQEEIVEGELLPEGQRLWTLELKVQKGEDGNPNFTGAFAHGTVKERFLYLTHKREDNTIIKRIKIHLKSISWAQVETVLENPGSYFEVSVDGRGVASVPLLGDGWVVCTNS